MPSSTSTRGRIISTAHIANGVCSAQAVYSESRSGRSKTSGLDNRDLTAESSGAEVCPAFVVSSLIARNGLRPSVGIVQPLYIVFADIGPRLHLDQVKVLVPRICQAMGGAGGNND